MSFLPDNPFQLIFFLPLIVVVTVFIAIVSLAILSVIHRGLEIFILACLGEDPGSDIKFALLPVAINGERVWFKKYYYVSVWAYGPSLHSGGYSKIVARQLTPFNDEARRALENKHRYRGKAC